ncbi:MAG: methyltransferase domain-containing protein [Anaerolineae bacterium]|jgi:ubiquinone/menaquinone biosynthesis C-methylase UbiE
MKDRPTGAGRSSFDLVDVGKLFSALELSPGDVFLDLGSGAGAYALAAVEHVSDQGVIYAVDLWEEGIERLRSEVERRQISTVYPKRADISKHIPLEDGTVDVGLVSTVLHDLVRDGTHEAALREVRRVLRPEGRLAVVEFKKLAGSPGPPVEVRLSPEEVEELLRHHAFEVVAIMDVGPYHYLSMSVAERKE